MKPSSTSVSRITRMAGIAERLQSFINHTGLSLHAFSELAHVGNGTINKVVQEEGFRSMGIDKFLDICEAFPELNPMWLLFGKEEMLNKPRLVEKMEENGRF